MDTATGKKRIVVYKSNKKDSEVKTIFMSLEVKEKNSLQSELSAEEARAIAKDAYVYGFPLVDSYRIQYAYFVDKNNPEYKGAWNELHNTARVYTPDDKAVQTPNSDTPYSFAGVDLRTEPIVITVPTIEKERYYSIQFIDMYTFNFAYVGSRATGNYSGNYLLVGPGWKGDKPAEIKQVIQSETELVFLLYRTQLFNPDDIENVRKIQAEYKIHPLSQYLKQPAPKPAPAIKFINPHGSESEKTSLEFFRQLNFILQFCPVHPSEKKLMERFAKLNIGANKNFNKKDFSPNIRKSIEDGIGDALTAFKAFKEAEVDTGRKSSADGFGTREYLKNDYMSRMSSAVLGIYGNSKEEAMYPAYFVDAEGNQPNGKKHRYTLRFQPGQLPPVHSFWSFTLYELPASLLSANPINRYLINSTMLESLIKDPDGGITIYVQHQSPGKNNEPNWLPAPAGPFFCILRLYWPKKEVLDDAWTAPPMRVNNE